MKKTFFAALLLALIALLASCSPAAQPTNTPIPEIPTQVQVAATVALEPTPTPQPQPGKVILSADAALLPEAEALLNELSAPAGLTVETRPAGQPLQPGEITADVKLVVMLNAPGNAAELAAAAPQTQFVVTSAVDVTPAANLTVIRQRAENQVFVAGFLSTLFSPDFRGAGLLPSDGPLAALLQEAYVNGGRYYCGVCAPGWPLGMKYPQAAALPTASDGPTWQASAAALFDNQKADVYFLAPEAARPEVVGYLQDRTQFDRAVLVIGTQPPVDGLQAQWAASVRFDDLAVLRQVWADAAAGKGGTVVEAPLLVDYVNEELVGPGRLRLVDELLDEIAAGRISPFTVAP